MAEAKSQQEAQQGQVEEAELGQLDQIVEQGRFGPDEKAQTRGRDMVKRFVSEVVQGSIQLSQNTETMLNARIALVAALILASDPFTGGLSGLFHVDGLLMTWSILSLLALALGIGLGQQDQGGRRRVLWIIVSGMSAALAVLSKSPGLLLLFVRGIRIHLREPGLGSLDLFF